MSAEDEPVGETTPPDSSLSATAQQQPPPPETTVSDAVPPAPESPQQDLPMVPTPPPPRPLATSGLSGTPPPPTTPDTPTVPSVPIGAPAAGASPAPTPEEASATMVVSEPSTPLESAIFQVRRVIVGQSRMIERLMVCLLASGHALLEGVPGIAKTLAAETLAKVVGGSFVRIQFTPDLLPADIVGTRIWRASEESFDIELGPIVANFVLADEINRAPAKVQSALLEAMAEKQVSVGGETYELPKPFLVLATQNPIESEGVYPLPEAQRDRFLMKILVDYPSPLEEVEIVQRMGVEPPEPTQVLTLDDLAELQTMTKTAFVDRNVVEYAVSLTMATRNPAAYGLNNIGELVAYGASPRASLGLVAGGRAMAVLRGRDYVLPQDVFDVAPEIMRHRIVLSYEALARELTADHIVAQILSTVPAPRIAPSQDRSGWPAAG